jgi:ferredoxin-like protein FixX
MTTESAGPSVPSVRVEDKLYYNRYLVDAGRAHIKVRPHETPSPELLSLLTCRPARCYDTNLPDHRRADRGHRVELSARRLRGAVQVRVTGT